MTLNKQLVREENCPWNGYSIHTLTEIMSQTDKHKQSFLGHPEGERWAVTADRPTVSCRFYSETFREQMRLVRRKNLSQERWERKAGFFFPSIVVDSSRSTDKLLIESVCTGLSDKVIVTTHRFVGWKTSYNKAEKHTSNSMRSEYHFHWNLIATWGQPLKIVLFNGGNNTLEYIAHPRLHPVMP